MRDDSLPDKSWTAERIALLKDLWANGATADAIGVRLGGLSRSSVLGKIFRLRLAPSKAGTRAKKAVGNPPAQWSVAFPALSLPAPTDGNSLARRRPSPEQERLRPGARSPGAQGKTLLELTNDCCRWPYRRPGTRKFFFCGADGADLEGGIPYCARHMQRAYPGMQSSDGEARSALAKLIMRARG
jgi:GcrA cell cycle regulator